MIKKFRFYSFLTGLFLLMGHSHFGHSQINNSCENLFIHDSENSKINFDNEFWSHIDHQMPEALLKRYWNDPLSIDIQKMFLNNLTGKTQSAQFSNSKHNVISRTLLVEDHLFLDIVQIQAAPRDELKIGDRPKNIDTFFIKFIVGMFRTIQILKVQNPAINHVLVQAINIKNPMLIEFLKPIGFQSVSKPHGVYLEKQFDLLNVANEK